MTTFSSLTPDDRGLVPAVVQDDRTGTVLMVAFMNEEAFVATAETGFVHFWSRSRSELWKKGATSGNTLEVVEVTPDCDGDVVLVRAVPSGPVCHTGHLLRNGIRDPTRFRRRHAGVDHRRTAGRSSGRLVHGPAPRRP